MAIALDTPPQSAFADLQARLIDYANRVEQLRSPDDVLDELNAITTQSLPLSVLGAARFPLKSGDWESIQVGKSVFLHKDVPEGWWEDYTALAPRQIPSHVLLGDDQHGVLHLDGGQADVRTHWR